MLGAVRLGRSIVVLAVTAASVIGPAWAASATIVIVAVDRSTGEVGAVGSSCAAVDLAGVAVLVPGEGAAAVLGARGDAPAEEMLESLHGADAGAVLREAKRLDPDGTLRFAVAVLPGRAAVGGRGTAAPVAGAGAATSAAAQGEWLRNESEVRRALDAFEAARGPLAQRLLDALDAGNRGGGDRRCGRQRASSAFLIVTDRLGSVVVPARGSAGVHRRQRHILSTLGGQIASDEITDRLLEAAALPRPTGPGAPSVYLSLLQPRRGFDAVSLLRQAYEETAASATPTPDASSEPAASSAAVRAGAATSSAGSPGAPGALTAVLAIAAAVVVLVLVLARRSRRASDRTHD